MIHSNTVHSSYPCKNNYLAEGSHFIKRSPLKYLYQATSMERFTATKNDGSFADSIFVFVIVPTNDMA